MRFETAAVHAGHSIDPSTGAVGRGITMATTFQRGPDGDYPGGHVYSRDSNPNRSALEEALAALEGGGQGFAFSSGMAAVHALIACLKPGDHVIAPDDAYYTVRLLLEDFFADWGLESSFVDQSKPDLVAEAIRPNTKLLWMETPSNPMLKIADIRLLAEIAAAKGILTAVDNTWATPYLQRPLDLGADVVLHSSTKYLGGHCDVMGGALVTTQGSDLDERLHLLQNRLGSIPSPFDSWLIHRGLQTLPVRMDRHCKTAELVADYLNEHERVEKVYFPGLPCHQGIAVASKQMANWGGMLSFKVRGGEKEAFQVANGVKLITQATSLGGVHTLIEHRRSVEGPKTITPENLLRLSVGLEHPEDLIEDLGQALQAMGR